MSNKKMLNVKLEEDDLRKLKVYCALNDLSITEVIEELIRSLDINQYEEMLKTAKK